MLAGLLTWLAPWLTRRNLPVRFSLGSRSVLLLVMLVSVDSGGGGSYCVRLRGVAAPLGWSRGGFRTVGRGGEGTR